jgi:hypothetical protein
MNAGMKSAVLRAVVEQLDRTLDNVSDDDLTALGGPHRIAARMAALIPLPHPLDRDIGPFYDTRALCEWIGVSRQALDSRVRNHTLLGCPTDGGSRAYPVWQFTDDGDTIPHLHEVLTVLAAGSPHPWTWATWLAGRVRGQLGGRPAWTWLADGRDPEPVLTAARSDAARWAH